MNKYIFHELHNSRFVPSLFVYLSTQTPQVKLSDDIYIPMNHPQNKSEKLWKNIITRQIYTPRYGQGSDRNRNYEIFPAYIQVISRGYESWKRKKKLVADALKNTKA